MNFKNIFFSLFLFLFLVSVTQGAEILEINETFSEVTLFKQLKDFDFVDYETFTTTDSTIYEDRPYDLYVGRNGLVSATATSYIQVNDYWVQYPDQIVYSDSNLGDAENLVLLFDIGEYFTLTNNSYVEFSFNNSLQNNVGLVLSLMFKPETDNCSLVYRTDTVAYGTSRYPEEDICGINSGTVETDLTCDNGFSGFTYLKNNTVMTRRITFDNCVTSRIEDLRYMYIGMNDPGGSFEQKYYFDNIFLGNFVSGANEEPQFNITFDEEVLCINNTGDSATFTFNISVNDLEGDTIFFASQFTDTSNFNKSIFFSRRNCLFFNLGCNPVKDYSILSNYVNPNDDSCTINNNQIL